MRTPSPLQPLYVNAAEPEAERRAEGQTDVVNQLLRELNYFQVLAEVAKSLASELDRASLLQMILQAVSELLRPNHWALFIADPQQQELRIELAVGEAFDRARTRRVPYGAGAAAWVAANGEALVAPSIREDQRCLPLTECDESIEVTSLMCAPLIARSRLLGVLEVVRDARDPQPYRTEHLQLLLPLADFAAIAISNAEAFARIEQLTLVDDHTSLYNTRFLHACMEQEIARARRYGRVLSVVFIDLDRLKVVNDTHGHFAGSALLREVGRRLRTAVRETDKPVRYGGDEFVVIMPETTKSGAEQFAERVRQLIKQPVLLEGGLNLTMAASFGVASMPEDATDAKTLLQSADRAMYEAKRAGRDKVVCAGRSSVPGGDVVPLERPPDGGSE